MSESIEAYERAIKEHTLNKLPMGQDELKAFHTSAKKAALALFKKKAIGDVVEDFTAEFV